VDIDLGLNLWLRNEKLRLVRINAPEMTGPDKACGMASRDFLRDLISPGNWKNIDVFSTCRKTIRYGSNSYPSYISSPYTRVLLGIEQDPIE
jgi:endonuclease YncB( thermonuclease family)